ncbi:hypothetical protein HG531_007012 [Fusarium graminearum]|nr:hypothetical protein HG531_007012 [Fusarium graminearum]
MAVHDCFFHLVEWIEYDETEPKWEVIWKVKSVCSGAMIDFADDNKQTCVSQLEGEGCIVWREDLSSFYDIFTYCEWPDLSGLSNPPSCAVSSHSPSNRYHYARKMPASKVNGVDGTVELLPAAKPFTVPSGLMQ